MENLEVAKSIFREGNKIKNYFSTYGSTIEEYREMQKRDRLNNILTELE